MKVDGIYSLGILWSRSGQSVGVLKKKISQLKMLPPVDWCLDKNGEQKVSTSNEKGEVCFSRKPLTFLPPETLKPQILALGAHELLHFLGEADEQIANDLRDWFLLRRRFVDPDLDLVCEVSINRYNDYNKPIVEREVVLSGNLRQQVDLLPLPLVSQVSGQLSFLPGFDYICIAPPPVTVDFYTYYKTTGFWPKTCLENVPAIFIKQWGSLLQILPLAGLGPEWDSYTVRIQCEPKAEKEKVTE